MAVATVLWAVLLVVAGRWPTVADLIGHRVVHGVLGSPWTVLAERVTDAGSSVVLYPVVAVAAWLLSPRHGGRRLLDAAVGPLILGAGSALRFTLSVVVARPRPPAADWLYPATGFAFPSGHTTNTTIAVRILVLLHARTESRLRRRAIAWSGAVLAAVAVGWSRVYLGVHWPTDVAAGWAFGSAWVALTTLVGNRIAGTSPSHE